METEQKREPTYWEEQFERWYNKQSDKKTESQTIQILNYNLAKEAFKEGYKTSMKLTGWYEPKYWRNPIKNKKGK